MGVFSKSAAALTSIERAELTKLEEQVTTGVKAFAIAGRALARIREKQLYRETADTFESYVERRWGMSKQHAGRLIAAADVVATLEPLGSGAMPLSEYQARQLAPLPADAQQEVWAEVVQAAPVDATGKPVVTTDAIKTAAAKRTSKGKRRKARPRPVRILVPGATVIVTPNRKFSGSVEDALRSALEKLGLEHVAKKAA